MMHVYGTSLGYGLATGVIYAAFFIYEKKRTIASTLSIRMVLIRGARLAALFGMLWVALGVLKLSPVLVVGSFFGAYWVTLLGLVKGWSW